MQAARKPLLLLIACCERPSSQHTAPSPPSTASLRILYDPTGNPYTALMAERVNRSYRHPRDHRRRLGRSDGCTMTVTATTALKRVIVGRPLQSDQLHETLLPKWLALPVFASDPLSSVAYATEEIVLVLAARRRVLPGFSNGSRPLIAALLVIVVVSYRQTCYAYPNGGGAFASAWTTSARTPL